MTSREEILQLIETFRSNMEHKFPWQDLDTIKITTSILCPNIINGMLNYPYIAYYMETVSFTVEKITNKEEKIIPHDPTSGKIINVDCMGYTRGIVPKRKKAFKNCAMLNINSRSKIQAIKVSPQTIHICGGDDHSIEACNDMINDIKRVNYYIQWLRANPEEANRMIEWIISNTTGPVTRVFKDSDLSPISFTELYDIKTIENIDKIFLHSRLCFNPKFFTRNYEDFFCPVDNVPFGSLPEHNIHNFSGIGFDFGNNNNEPTFQFSTSEPEFVFNSPTPVPTSTSTSSTSTLNNTTSFSTLNNTTSYSTSINSSMNTAMNTVSISTPPAPPFTVDFQFSSPLSIPISIPISTPVSIPTNIPTPVTSAPPLYVDRQPNYGQSEQPNTYSNFQQPFQNQPIYSQQSFRNQPTYPHQFSSQQPFQNQQFSSQSTYFQPGAQIPNMPYSADVSYIFNNMKLPTSNRNVTYTKPVTNTKFTIDPQAFFNTGIRYVTGKKTQTASQRFIQKIYEYNVDLSKIEEKECKYNESYYDGYKITFEDDGNDKKNIHHALLMNIIDLTLHKIVNPQNKMFVKMKNEDIKIICADEDVSTIVLIDSKGIMDRIPPHFNREVIEYLIKLCIDYVDHSEYIKKLYSILDMEKDIHLVIGDPVIEKKNICTVTLNYSLGSPINKIEFRNVFLRYPQFIVEYDPTVDKNVTISLEYDVKDFPAHLLNEIHQNKGKCFHTIIIYDTGEVTQSGPHIDLMIDVYNQFRYIIHKEGHLFFTEPLEEKKKKKGKIEETEETKIRRAMERKQNRVNVFASYYMNMIKE